MSSRADKTLKQQKEKHHAILRELVQEPANKTCADCLAKGPRWSSWSLGVFVCIRCAGIHRNLGTHISKVKSVDLDSWSVEQIEHILKWGNKRAAEYYECYLPKDFTRPQGNHAVESFIRNKYEKKLYIMKDGEPEPNPQSKLDRLKGNTSASMGTENKNVSQTKRRERPEKKPEQKPRPNETILSKSKDNQVPNGGIVQRHLAVNQAHHPKSSSMNDLLSLSTPASNNVAPVKSSASTDDLLSFGAFSSPVSVADQTENNDLFGASTESQSNPQEVNDLSNQTSTAKSTKDSILSLYSTSSMSQPQPMYGVPGGMYMTQQQNMQQQMAMQQQQMNYGYKTNQMPNNQMNQMNMQMQGMNLNTQQFNKTQIQGFTPQSQYNTNQFNMAGNTSFNSQVPTSNSQFNMQYNKFNQTPVSNIQTNNYTMQNSNPQLWQVNQMPTSMVGGMPSSNMMGGVQSNNMMGGMQSNNMMGGMQSNNMMGGMQSNKMGGMQSNNMMGGMHSNNMMSGMQPNNMMGGMQANNTMNNMNSGHTMNNLLWN